MNKETLIKALQLDSICNILSWYDRVLIHQNRDFSRRIIALCKWIELHEWECPKREYGHDRVLYFFDPVSKWMIPDEHYFKRYPEYKEDLTAIKNL